MGSPPYRLDGKVFSDRAQPLFVKCQSHDRRMQYVREDVARWVYREYEAQGHGSQSFDRLHERGGFGVGELVVLLVERLSRFEEAPTSARPEGGDRD